MSTQTHEQYYVPAQSKWPIVATIALLVTFFGLGTCRRRTRSRS